MSHLSSLFKMLVSSKLSSSKITIFLPLIFLGIVVAKVNSQQHQQQQQYYGSPLKSTSALETSMPTVTVRGFLNFRTTVDGTIIVFTPSPTGTANSKPPNESPTTTVAPVIQPTQAPSVVQDEIRPTRASSVFATYPTGLVTVLGGTVVNEGSTTIYETKVIGTYISGKYAQILSSSTKFQQNEEVASPTVRPTPAYSRPMIRATRIAQHQPAHYHHHSHHHNGGQNQARNDQQNNNQRTEEEHAPNAITGTVKKIHPLRAKSMKLIESSKARHLNARLQLNPLKSRWAKLKDNGENNGQPSSDPSLDQGGEQSKPKVHRRLKLVASKRFTLPPRQSPRVKMNRFKTKLPPTQAEEMQHYHDMKEKEINDKPETVEDGEEDDNNKQIIDDLTKEKILEGLTSTTPLPTYVGNNHTIDDIGKPLQEQQEENLKIDPSRVVKEVQTITSEVTQHVEGNHLQVKTLTLTTTIERTLHPTESVEFDTDLIQPTLDISINNIEATSIPETPALVISRTYSVTERTMRTTVVPVFDGTATQSHTVTESFFIRKLITAYRTLPPGDMILIDSTSTSAFNPDMNTAALINGTDVDDLSMAEQQTVQPSSVESNILPTEMPNILSDNNVNSGFVANQIEPSLTMGGQIFPQPNNQLAQQFDLNNPLLLAAVLQNPQLAALYFGLQQMKQQATQYSTITKPTKVLQTETLYNTKMVSYYDGRQTRSRTILEPTATKEKLVETFTTEVVPIVNNQYQMQQAQLQNIFANQLGMMPAVPAMAQAPQFQLTPTLKHSTVLKTLTTVTDQTMTKSKVYTLVYNAFSTRYRTITSTSVVPTTVTTVLTETIPLSPISSTMLPNFFG